jgi:hypothetical protein
MRATENTNAVVTVGRRYVCHLPFEVHKLSTSLKKRVTLRTSYNIEITQHKHTIQSKHDQTGQTIEKCWFSILDLLRYCDKRDMAKGLWIARYEFEILNGKSK